MGTLYGFCFSIIDRTISARKSRTEISSRTDESCALRNWRMLASLHSVFSFCASSSLVGLHAVLNDEQSELNFRVYPSTRWRCNRSERRPCTTARKPTHHKSLWKT